VRSGGCGEIIRAMCGTLRRLNIVESHCLGTNGFPDKA
jgi:hypothetical protein